MSAARWHAMKKHAKTHSSDSQVIHYIQAADRTQTSRTVQQLSRSGTIYSTSKVNHKWIQLYDDRCLQSNQTRTSASCSLRLTAYRQTLLNRCECHSHRYQIVSKTKHKRQKNYLRCSSIQKLKPRVQSTEKWQISARLKPWFSKLRFLRYTCLRQIKTWSVEKVRPWLGLRVK